MMSRASIWLCLLSLDMEVLSVCAVSCCLVVCVGVQRVSCRSDGHGWNIPSQLGNRHPDPQPRTAASPELHRAHHRGTDQRNEAWKHIDARPIAPGMPTVRLHTEAAWISPCFSIHINRENPLDTAANRANARPSPTIRARHYYDGAQGSSG